MDAISESRPRFTTSCRCANQAATLLFAAAITIGSQLPAQAGRMDSSALSTLQAAADKGDVTAQTQLGDAYAGWLDSTNAVVWYRKAAGQEDPHSEWQLARYYEFGGGQLERDPQTALAWHVKAADQGYANAQFDLGQWFEHGTTGAPDYTEAYKWYTLAARNDSVLAQANRDRLAPKMTSEQKEEAQRRADSFRAKSTAPRPDDASAVNPTMAVQSPLLGGTVCDRASESSESCDPEVVAMLARISDALSDCAPGQAAESETVGVLVENSVESILTRMAQVGVSLPPDHCDDGQERNKQTCPSVASPPCADLKAAAVELPSPVARLPVPTNRSIARELPDRPVAAVELPPRPAAVRPAKFIPAEPFPLVTESPPAIALTKREEHFSKPAADISPIFKPTPVPPSHSHPRLVATQQWLCQTLEHVGSTSSTVTVSAQTVPDRPASQTPVEVVPSATSISNFVSSAAAAPSSRNPALAEKLHLRAVAAFGRRRAASINGRSVFQGEEAEFVIDGVPVKVRCVAIKEASAVLQVAGCSGTTELKLAHSGN